MDSNYHAELLFNKVHGNDSDKKLKELFSDICPELATYSIGLIFGNIYANEILSLRERELLNIAALVVEGSQAQQRNHILAAYRVGCKPKEIIAAILQMLIITGFPKVVNAILLTKEVFDENKILV